ncbi:hypothetical protein AB833_12085 [Chromatiales bacterium (ex Bugula neritina AB1)]|nr:hypothetical protein AB833_12085 [Chromatiales bacterium (ex Bugula neritina AB1)]
MQIITWNIQAAKGVDNVTSVERIASVTKDLADADIICYQEVFNGEINGKAVNQVEALAGHFPKHRPIFGAAINRAQRESNTTGTGRLQFGNLVLSRLPVEQISLHRLPQPAQAGIACMPRQAVELLLPWQDQIFRVVTTHLDFFAADQRSAQTRYLQDWHRQTLDRAQFPGAQGGELQFASLPETDLSIYCGDFNFNVDSTDYKLLTQGGRSSNSVLIDCWRHVNAHTPHDPTCGIFDQIQWTEGPHCRDFFFASSALADRVKRVTVDTETNASDHQPLLLTLS